MAVWNPRANALFASLLELPPPQRPASLARACGADAELQRQVESLLAAHARAGSFLDRPAAGAAPPRIMYLSGNGPRQEAASAGELQPEGPLGDFRLVREVGRGGMGVVYEAVQISLGRRVALKVLPFAAALDAKQLQRFKNEAHAAAQLQHPNIVPVYAVGCERGVHYYAMQFIEGWTLAALIGVMGHLARPEATTAPHVQPGPSDPSERPTQNLAAVSTEHAARDPAHFRLAASLGVQAAEALEHAHQLGVVHRDIKPANLLLDGQAKLWVTDFGLARLNGDPGLTLTGDLLGTVRYMSPEQTEGKHTALDHRTDVYSLGVTLYELLTLRPAFEGHERQEVLRQILAEEPTPPRGLNAGIPADLETIVLKALEKSPSDRYATAGELADDLRRFLEDAPIRARRPTLGQRLRRWGRRHQPLVWSATLFGLLALGLAAAVLVWQARDEAARERAALARQVKTTQEIHNALTKAQSLRDKARGSRGAAGWTEARAMAKRAEALAESGPVDPELAAQVQSLLRELAEEEQDQQLLAALDAARLAQAETAEAFGGFVWEHAVPLYREALRAHGLPAGELAVEEAAARIRERPAAVREALVAALDDWIALAENPEYKMTEPHLGWLREVVTAADTGAWGKDYRAALAEKDPARRRVELAKLAEAADVRQLPAGALTRLALRLRDVNDNANAVGLLRRAAQRYPGDFWVNHRLGEALRVQGKSADLAEVVRYLTVAMALRPDCHGTHHQLGNALWAKGQTDEAIQEFRAALAINPKYFPARYRLGYALLHKGQMDEAIQEFRAAVAAHPEHVDAYSNLGYALLRKGQTHEAIQVLRTGIAIFPKNITAHHQLGNALWAKGQTDEAIQEFRAALENNPKDASVHSGLGHVLREKGQLDEAIQEFRAALEGNPNSWLGHNNLGNALRAKGQLDEAITAYREVLRLNPNYAEAHCNLGRILREKGQYAEALASLRRGHELSSKLPSWNYPSAEWVRQAAQMIALEPQFLAILKGEAQPADVAERLTLAQMCADRALYVAAVRFWSEAFAADPKLADDLQAEHRYSAACAAALGGAGQAKDSPPPDDAAKAQLREQARTWLQADLAANAKHLDSKNPKAGWVVRQRLQGWKSDFDLAGLRIQEAVAKLPAEEQEACRKLWAEVETLLQKARETTK
jgi:serine/threonine protein kinase/Flp pilus assembly protein TadD